MSPSRSFLLLAGVALLGAIASRNPAMADALAPFLDATGETARGTSQSVQRSAVATDQSATEALTQVTVQERSDADSNAEPVAGNPLWALPLEQLSITRERPIFLPSRRPRLPPPTNVAPVMVRQPSKPPEPERPAVSLIGTVNGTDLQIGVFLEKATQNIVRLRLGEDHQGWVLRLVKPREVILVKDVEQILALEPPGGAPAARGPTVLPLVPNSLGTMPVINTADYVDEQPLPARGAQRQRR